VLKTEKWFFSKVRKYRNQTTTDKVDKIVAVVTMAMAMAMAMEKQKGLMPWVGRGLIGYKVHGSV
jgi:uncharacterized membrane protein YbaN (DUF454 family)